VVFHCTQDAQCTKPGMQGTCENALCTFGDRHCDSGRAYDSSAGDNAGTCVDVTLCPTPPAMPVGDEDGDLLDDSCDPCPISKYNGDADADGVGDDCDPNPYRKGDHIEIFEGFHNGLPTGWSSTGTVTQMGDQLENSGGDIFIPRAGTPSETVTIGATAKSSPSDGFHTIHLYNPMDSQFHQISCRIGAMFTTGQPILASGKLQLSDEQVTPSPTTPMTFSFQLATFYQLVLTRKGGDFTCTSGATAVSATYAVTITQTGTDFGSPLTADYSYVMVVTSP
jgi:hypothetical protein